MRTLAAVVALSLAPFSTAWANPDLIIDNMTYKKLTNGYHIWVTVKNASVDAAAGPYYVDLFLGEPAPPQIGEFGDLWAQLPSIPAWGIHKVEFVVAVRPDNGWFDALVDTDRFVAENNENNNHRDLFVP